MFHLILIDGVFEGFIENGVAIVLNDLKNITNIIKQNFFQIYFGNLSINNDKNFLKKNEQNSIRKYTKTKQIRKTPF